MFDLMPFGWNENRNLLNPFHDFEKNFFNGMSSMMAGFRTDIQDKGDCYVLEAELPGFDKEDISIQVDDNMLTIRAEHKQEEEDKKDKNYVRQERHWGMYERSFSINGVKSDEISAGYEKGVLTLKLPKEQPQVPASRQIEIQ